MEPENAESDQEPDAAGRGPAVPDKGKGAKSLDRNKKTKLDSAHAMNVEVPNKVLDNTDTTNKDLRRLIFSKPHQKMERLTNTLQNIN